MTYKTTVCNKGSTALKTLDIELYYNRSTAPTCATGDSQHSYVGGLGAGKCTSRTFSRSNAPPGKALAWIMVDADCAVAESDEKNNVRSSNIGFGPDLYVSAVKVTATIFKATYDVTVCNKGDATLKTFDLGLFYDRSSAPACASATSQKTSISGLAKGKCTTRSFIQATPWGGSYKAWAMVDSGCAISETTESNNSASASYVVKTDYYVAKITAKPKAKTYTVTYEVTVCNKGANSNTPFNLGLYFHSPAAPGCAGTPSKLWVINGLKAGLCVTRSHVRSGAPAGSYIAWGRADSDCKSVELDEANNNMSAKYTVALMPDLHVTSFSTSVANNDVTFNATVCNKGAAFTTPVALGLYHNRSAAPTCAAAPDDTVIIAGLGAGACTPRTFKRSMTPPGLYLGWVLADSGCKVTETNEGDNAKSAGYMVITQLPDMGVDGAVADIGTDGAQPDMPHPDAGAPDLALPDVALPDKGDTSPDAGPELGAGDLGAGEQGAGDLGADQGPGVDKGDVAHDGGADAGSGGDADADAGATDAGKIKTEGSPGYDATSGSDTLGGGDEAGSGDGCECGVGDRAGERAGGLWLLLLGLLVVMRRRG